MTLITYLHPQLVVAYLQKRVRLGRELLLGDDVQHRAGERHAKFVGRLLVFLAVSSSALVSPAQSNVTAVLCKMPAGVVCRGDTAEMVLQPGFSAKGLSWRLLDWRGGEVRRGIWPAEGPLRLESLPVGAYTLVPTYSVRGRTENVCDVPSRRTTEGGLQQLHDTIVTVLEPLAEPLPKDSCFAIMTALSCCTIPDAAANRRNRGDYPWFGGDGTLLHAELLKTLGIPNVREILLWNREQVTSNSPPRIEKTREEPAWRYLAERGIGVDFFNQSTPEWAVGTTTRARRHDGKLREVTRNLTHDYKRLYDYYKWAAETFAGRAISFEHWNEPDICGDEPAWDYAASMKAAYLGVKAGNANVPVLQGSFCLTPFTGYNRLVMANDVARYSDIFNYHTYADLRDIPSFMEALRQNLAEAGVPNRAIWLTEMNTNQEGDADLPSVRAGNKAHSPDQQRVLVEYVAKGEILHLMEGVARTFYFILPCINEREGCKDWGLSRRDGCMKPAYAALANLIRRVGHARLVGEVGLGKGVRGFLFEFKDGTQTLVVWAQSDLDMGGRVTNSSFFARTVDLHAPGIDSVTVYDACGTPRTEKVENGVLHLAVDRYASYVTGLRGLKATRPARPVGTVGALSTPASMDPTLVVRIDLDSADFTLGGQKTIAEMNVPEGHATIVVWNLSETAKAGSLSVEGVGTTGLPASVTVPAWGKAEVPVRLRPGADGALTDVWIRGTFGGKTISPLKMQVRNQMELEARARVVTPNLSDLASWQKNDNAPTRSFAWDAQEKAFRFDVAWDSTERNPWAFERLVVDPSQVKGLFAVEYEAKMVQDKIENDTRHSVFYVCNGPRFKTSSYRVEPPRDGWERRRVTILPEHGANVTGLQFGCCPRGSKLTFWVRNVRLLCAAAAARTVSTADELLEAVAAVATNTAAPREIRLTAGRFYLPRPIELTAAHSNLVLRGAGAGRTFLYGGVRVTGWTKEKGTPFCLAPLPASCTNVFRTLVKDGTLAPVATYPGGTNRFSHLGQFAPKILSSLQGGWQRKPTDAECREMPYRVEDLPDTVDLANADIRLFHMWSDSLCTVSNVDRAAHVLWTRQPANWAMGAGNRRQYEVLNVREGMTEPGRWYLDRAKRVLHYWPKPDEDLSKIVFVAPTLPYVIGINRDVRAKRNRRLWARNVVIADLTVSASAPSVGEMSNFGGSAITAAVSSDMTDGLRLENVNVSEVGGAGISMDNATHCVLAGCDVRNTGARGFAFGGWAAAGDNLIVSNRICDVGLVYRGACGLAAGGTNLVVRRNEICRIPYCGIIGGGSDNLYEENYIHHVMQVLHDGGAIYGNLTRCVLRRNVVHDVVPDGKGFGVHAYYPDEGSRDCLIEDNYAEGVGTPSHNHMTVRTVVRGNTFVFRDKMHISFSRSHDCAFSNNTLVCAGDLTIGDPDAVPHWENNFAIRPSDPENAASRRVVGLWTPDRPQQKKRWEGQSKARRVARPPVLDGAFGADEWPLTWEAIDRTADRHKSGFSGAMVRFAWDDEHLYVAFQSAAFRDSTVSEGAVWGKDDGIELLFTDGRRVRAFFAGASEIVPQDFAAAGVRVASANDRSGKPWRNRNVARYEISVPWKALGVAPKAGLKVPFNACAFMSEYGQLKYWEGVAPYPDGTPAGETPSVIVLDR